MPFLAENDLLIDPVARKLLARPCDLSNYVKVGNALMQLPAPEAQLEEVNSLDEEPPEYASLNDFLRKEFPDVFTLKWAGRLPPKGGPMHRIILKDETNQWPIVTSTCQILPTYAQIYLGECSMRTATSLHKPYL